MAKPFKIQDDGLARLRAEVFPKERDLDDLREIAHKKFITGENVRNNLSVAFFDSVVELLYARGFTITKGADE